MLFRSQDLTQGFFEVFLANHYAKDASRDKGRFRSFLLASIKHFMANEWKKANRQKRGGGNRAISFDALEAEERFLHEPAVESSAEQAFDRRWGQAILDRVMRRLQSEFNETGRANLFDSMKSLGLTAARSLSDLSPLKPRDLRPAPWKRPCSGTQPPEG